MKEIKNNNIMKNSSSRKIINTKIVFKIYFHYIWIHTGEPNNNRDCDISQMTFD